MAARIKSSSGINEILFPTEFPVNKKLYKLLIKQSAISLITDHKILVSLYIFFFVYSEE